MLSFAPLARLPRQRRSPVRREFASHVQRYHQSISECLQSPAWKQVERLAQRLELCWKHHRHVFLCGNGGSSANASHLANDLMLGLSPTKCSGIRATALAANPSILTCLGNDIGYDSIFAHQLRTLAAPNDVLIVLSGSGNSPNILQALHAARELNVTSYAILGFDGGAACALADHPIHFEVADMQVAEDLQMIVGHAVCQWLAARAQGERT